MKYFATTSAASRRAVDCVIVGVYNRGGLSAGAEDINAASGSALRNLIKSGDLSSDPGRCTILTGLAGVRAGRIAVVGLGKRTDLDVTVYRKSLTAAIKALDGSKTRQILNSLTLEPVRDSSPYYLARYSVETVADVLYRFSETKSKRAKKPMPLTALGHSIAKRGDAAKSGRGAEHGDAIANGVRLAKDLGNLPSNICTPSYLARTARKLAAGNGRLTTRVLNEAEMKKLGMGSLLSVTAGAVEPGKLIVMQYKGGSGAPIVLVGKGVTFDTGGISLKPGAGMDEMKFDMCGAASVIGTMSAIARMKLAINLTVIVPAVENMPSGSATKPGDIVKSMSGQTIEVLNTDAEGRLILCDALTYARRFKPAAVIDVATLTGACVIALGHHRTAIYANDDALRNEVFAAGDQADDTGWPMPMDARYTAQLKSNFADMGNIGGPAGGSVTAACFLGKFTDGMTWAHLDIAGTAWKSGAQKGATGRPVPMLSEFLLSRAGALP